MLGSWSSGRVGLMRALALVLSSALVTLGLLVLPTAAPATAADVRRRRRRARPDY